MKVNQQDRDRYGRVVGRVYAGGLDVNAEQIRRGMAWIYRKYNRDRSLLALEQEAQGGRQARPMVGHEPNSTMGVPAWWRGRLCTEKQARTGLGQGDGWPSVWWQTLLQRDGVLRGGEVPSEPMRVEQAGQGWRWGVVRVIVSLIRSCSMGRGGVSSEERSSRCPGSGAIRPPHKPLLRPLSGPLCFRSQSVARATAAPLALAAVRK